MYNFSLEGRTALVTGASGGIGQNITRAFLERGAKVIISGSNEEKLKNFEDALNLKDRVASVVCDLSDGTSTNQLLEKAESCLGPIDILVNNAGKTNDKLSIMMKDEDFENILQINLVSCFRLTKAAVKSMLKRNYGRIINITSIVGLTGNAGQVNYAASKAGIIGMSKSFAQEVATKGITINCIAPGFIATNMTDKISEKMKEQLFSKIPMKQFGSGEDVASCCVFLASTEAAYMTGQVLHPNGGMLMV